MISKIEIKNFKSIVDLTLELGRLNVFIGENGCGKTNILEAITCASIGAITPYLHDSLMSWRGVRVTEPHLMKTAFDISAKKNENIEIEIFNIKKEKIGTRMRLEESHYWLADHIYYASNKVTDAQIVKDITKADFNKDKIEKIYFDNIFGEGVIESFLNYAPENHFLRRFEEEGQLRPLGIRGEGLFKHIVEIYKKKPELLEKIGDKLRLIGWFQGFEVPKDLMFTERRINIKDKYLQELDFFDQRSANEGFLFLLFYFTLFISPFTPKFFAIDNIDNALNPKLCAELTKQLAILAKENDKQAILTTHNPAILDGLDLTDDSQRLFTIYRNADGHTVAKRIKAPKKIKGVEPIRLSEAYIRGYLGGLPQNF